MCTLTWLKRNLILSYFALSVSIEMNIVSNNPQTPPSSIRAKRHVICHRNGSRLVDCSFFNPKIIVEDNPVKEVAVQSSALDKIASLSGKSVAATKSWLNQTDVNALVQRQIPQLLANHKTLSSLAASLTSPWGNLISAVLDILSASKLSNQADLRKKLQKELENILTKAHPAELFVWKLEAYESELDKILEQRKKYLSSKITNWIGDDFFTTAGETPIELEAITAEYWQELFRKFYLNISTGSLDCKEKRVKIMSKSDNACPIETFEDSLIPRVNIDYSKALPSTLALTGTVKTDLEQCILSVQKIRPIPALISAATLDLLTLWSDSGLFSSCNVPELKKALSELQEPHVDTTSVLLIVKQLTDRKII